MEARRNLGPLATPLGQALRTLALTLVDIKFARKSTCLAMQPISNRPFVVTATFQQMKYRVCLRGFQEGDLEMFFFFGDLCVLACPFAHPTQVSGQGLLAANCNFLRIRLTKTLGCDANFVHPARKPPRNARGNVICGRTSLNVITSRIRPV